MWLPEVIRGSPKSESQTLANSEKRIFLGERRIFSIMPSIDGMI